MPRLPRPAVLLTVSLALTAALVLTACSGARPSTAPAVGTGLGSLLTYQVTSGSQTYPFVVSIRQNDAAGIAFGYDLGDGAQSGTVTMSAAAVQTATTMANSFGSTDYRLTDKTSVWLARGPFARLRDGESVDLNLGGERDSKAFSGACGETFSVGTAASDPFGVPACRFTADGQELIIADDDAQPLILSMDTGQFTVTLRAAAMAN